LQPVDDAIAPMQETPAVFGGFGDDTANTGGFDLQPVDDAIAEPEVQDTSAFDADALGVQSQSSLPAGWTSAVDPSTNQTYYFNAATNTTQWEPPVVDVPVPVQHTTASAFELPADDNTNTGGFDLQPVDDTLAPVQEAATVFQFDDSTNTGGFDLQPVDDTIAPVQETPAVFEFPADENANTGGFDLQPVEDAVAPEAQAVFGSDDIANNGGFDLQPVDDTQRDATVPAQEAPDVSLSADTTTGTTRERYVFKNTPGISPESARLLARNANLLWPPTSPYYVPSSSEQ